MSVSLDRPELLDTRLFINGEFVEAHGGEFFAVKNPATDEIIAQVQRGGGREADIAIAAADRAFEDWKLRPANERAGLLKAWCAEIRANRRDLAKILTAEQGKPISEALGEIDYGAGYFEWFAEEAVRAYGDIIPHAREGTRVLCLKQPVGVVACITPWNFPNAMLARKIAAALAAGCTVVCKPANETPLSAIALGVLAKKAGIPDGVVNIVFGDTPAIGKALTSSPIVRKLTFTGSTPVGKMLAADCAATMKRTSMELGGNAPFLVFEDADLDRAVEGAIAAKFRNAGQTCISANRFLVHETVAEAFTAKLVAAAGQLDLGPLIHERAAAGVRELVQDALNSGAVEAGPPASLDRPNSAFFGPVILSRVKPDMRISREEIFGPVATIMTFSTVEEAISLANDTPFGLAAYMYSRNNATIWKVSEALHYGMVGVNESSLSNPAAPFGGVKESGSGREGSKYGLDDYLDIKYVCVGI